MTAELNIDAERAAFDAWMKTRSGYPFAAAFANLMWAAWQAARRAPAPVADGLAPLPQLLLDRISDYGMARTEGMTDVDRVHLWETLITDVKRYAANAIAADRAQQAVVAPSDEQIDQIARVYFSEEWAQKHVKNAIHDAFVLARQDASPAQASTAPADGWKLVPVEPTTVMIQACDVKFVPRVALPFFVAAYKTMLEHAPSPAAQPVEQPVDDARDAARWRWFVQHGFFWRGANCLQTCWPRHGEIGAKEPNIGKPAIVNSAIDAAMQASKGATDGAVEGKS